MSLARQVVQATAWYPPYDLGGTEVYVEGLVEELASLGILSAVIAPRDPNAPSAYKHRSAMVKTWAVNERPVPDEFKLWVPHRGFDEFLGLLSPHKGAIYHQHAWTRGCGLHHLRAAKNMGFRTVLTVHVPGNICLRGTMLRFGEGPCDGRVDPTVCGACWGKERGLPKSVAEVIGRLPLGVARMAHSAKGRLTTALSARSLADRMKRQLEEMIACADRIVAVCQWLYDALALNGAPQDKLVLSRQGVSTELVGELGAVRRCGCHRSGPLRLLLLARWDPAKGIDTAVRAVRRLPPVTPVELRICGVTSADKTDYEQRVRRMAEGDPRIRIEGPLTRERVVEALVESDVLLVPSNWLETGPLTVLEAQAAGLFVLGSRRGGIAELVDEGDGGELVEAGDVDAWATAIGSLATRHEETGLPAPSRPVRTMAAVAAEMAELYRSV
jgi:glycosyltransferase involved in cell wall biosynthesis